MVEIIPFGFGTSSAAGPAYRFEGLDDGASVSCFITRSPVGRGAERHRHPYEEVLILLEGTARFTVADETFDVPAGTIVIVPAGTPHAFINLGPEPLCQVDIHPTTRITTDWLDRDATTHQGATA